MEKSQETLKSGDYRYVEELSGHRRLMNKQEKGNSSQLEVFRFDNATSQDSPLTPQPFTFQGTEYSPRTGRHWTANWPKGMERLAKTERLYAREGSLALSAKWRIST
jgi:adenine-specific DNA-methyltransferase